MGALQAALASAVGATVDARVDLYAVAKHRAATVGTRGRDLRRCALKAAIMVFSQWIPAGAAGQTSNNETTAAVGQRTSADTEAMYHV